MQKRFAEFNLIREAMAIVNKTTDVIVKVQQDQLFHGKDKDGKDLKPYRSAMYAAEKLSMNPLGVTDLKYTGAFYAGMFVDVGGDYFEIDSQDDKSDELTAKYGNIWGLNKEGRTSYIETSFMPGLKEIIGEKLKLSLE